MSVRYPQRLLIVVFITIHKAIWRIQVLQKYLMQVLKQTTAGTRMYNTLQLWPKISSGIPEMWRRRMQEPGCEDRPGHRATILDSQSNSTSTSRLAQRTATSLRFSSELEWRSTQLMNDAQYRGLTVDARWRARLGTSTSTGVTSVVASRSARHEAAAAQRDAVGNLDIITRAISGGMRCRHSILRSACSRWMITIVYTELVSI